MRAIDVGCTGKQVMYILRGFKTSDDAFRLSYSIVFDCSIRQFLDLFRSWLYIFHLSRFSGDGLVFSVSVFSGFFFTSLLSAVWYRVIKSFCETLSVL